LIESFVGYLVFVSVICLLARWPFLIIPFVIFLYVLATDMRQEISNFRRVPGSGYFDAYGKTWRIYIDRKDTNFFAIEEVK